MEPRAVKRVGDLIVVLDEIDEIRRAQPVGWLAAHFLLPGKPLALIQEAAFHRRNEFLRSAPVIRVIRLVVAGECDMGAVMEIVVPERIEAIAAVLRRADQF